MKSCFIILCCSMLFVACENVKFLPIAGKWQLKSVDINGNISQVDTVWYNFQSNSIFSLQLYMPEWDSYLVYTGMRTQHDNTLSIVVTDNGIVDFSDWKSTNRSFTIVKINKRRLILQSEEGYVYSFIKF